MTPSDPAYGVDPEETWGRIGIDGTTEPVPARAGAYPEFYIRLAAALRGEGPPPVDPEESLEVLKVIDKVRACRLVTLPPSHTAA
jgi:predicted dehydrogenase